MVLATCRASDTVYFCSTQDLSTLAVIADGNGYNIHSPSNDFLREFFGPNIRKASTELKDLIRHLGDLGLPREGLVYDAALAAYLLDPSDGSYTLPRITKKLLGRTLTDAPTEGFGAMDAQQERAAAILDLYRMTLPLLKEQGMLSLYEDIELPLCSVLANMEQRGFLVDRLALMKFGSDLGIAVDQLQNEIYVIAGDSFNINSTKKVGELLFDRLGLPPLGKTKTGYSTNIEVLEKLRGKHPVVEKII